MVETSQRHATIVAGIHVFLSLRSKKVVDGRDKPGHDESNNSCFRIGIAAALSQRRQPRDRARRAGELKNVHAGVGAVDDVDIAAVVDFDIVCLDRHLAALLAIVELMQRLSVASVIDGMKCAISFGS